MSRRIAVMIAMFALWATACDRVPTEEAKPDEEEVRVAVVEPRVETVDDEEEVVEPEPIHFLSWPGRHEQMTFDLTWLGGDEPLNLRAEPDEKAPVVREGTWFDGEQFDWRSSRMYVQKPRPYRVTRDHEMVVTHYDAEADEFDLDDVVVDLEEEDRIFLYRYGGEQMCFLGIDSELVLGACPDDYAVAEDDTGLDAEEFKPGDRWKALSEQWWVEVDGAEGTGWFRVEDAPVDIHLRSEEGYDDIDGPDGAGRLEEP